MLGKSLDQRMTKGEKGHVCWRAEFAVFVLACFAIPALTLASCAKTYRVGKGSVKAAYTLTKGAAKLTVGTGKVAYKIGRW